MSSTFESLVAAAMEQLPCTLAQAEYIVKRDNPSLSPAATAATGTTRKENQPVPKQSATARWEKLVQAEMKRTGCTRAEAAKPTRRRHPAAYQAMFAETNSGASPDSPKPKKADKKGPKAPKPDDGSDPDEDDDEEDDEDLDEIDKDEKPKLPSQRNFYQIKPRFGTRA